MFEKLGYFEMRVIDADTKLAASKALYKRQQKFPQGYISDADKKSKPLKAKKLAVEPFEGPPARLPDLVSPRSRNSNETLRNLINKADTVLAHQERLIKEANHLLSMEKAARVYKKVSNKL